MTLAQANADVARMLLIAAAKFPMNPGWNPSAFRDARIAPRLEPLKDELVGDIGKTIWLLMATVSIVLLIACANVANLLLVRADGRRQELAIRAALGAGAARIARELLLESVLLGLAGGALGLGLAFGALRVLTASELPNLPRMHEISIDPGVLGFTLAISLLAGLVFGLLPVIKHARPHPAVRLRTEGRSTTASKERQQTRGVLVAMQVALALILLVGSGLMIRTFHALRRVEPGFSGAAELETVHIGIAEAQIKNPEQVARTEGEILRKIKTVPGVSAVAAISDLPLESGEDDPIYVQGRSDRETRLPPVRRFNYVSPGYVSTVGSRFIAGRDFTWNELYQKTPVALVSENLAGELWGNPRAAIGKHIRVTVGDYWREVVGVVADLRDDGIDRKPPTIVYWPLLNKSSETDESVIRGVAYLARTPRAGSSTLRTEIQAAVAAANPTLAISDVKTLQSVYDRSLARSSVTLVLLAIAGAMALLLGVVGIYGVISYSVSQRRREIGIRLALGAPLRAVMGLFLRQAFIMSGIGTICGLLAALAVTGLMRSLLFEVSPADPVTYICGFRRVDPCGAYGKLSAGAQGYED